MKRLATALTLGLAFLLAGCAAQENASNTTASPKTASKGIGLPAILGEIRNNPQNRDASVVFCQLSIAQSTNDFPIEAFFAGLFAVSEQDVDRTFCAALIESVIAGELTETDIARFDRQTGRKESFGIFLRKIMAAHLRLSGLTARRPDGEKEPEDS